MKYIAFIFLLILCLQTVAQHRKSIHQEELEYYNSLNFSTDKQWDEFFNYKYIPKAKSAEACTLNKVVFGWNPYWQASQYNNFQWDQISDLCWFSYEFSTSTGNPTNTHSWSTAAAVTAAQNNGKRVHLCVTMFSDHATFFASTTAQNNLITNLISALQQRNAIGINIDFEGVPSAQKDNLTAFMKNLSGQVHTAIPGSIISICLPAVDWSGTFDVVSMTTDPIASKNVDWFTIMGYDYYYDGSSQAGPCDPLYSLTTGYNYNLSKTLTYYISKGLAASKIILGLPYYGKDWPTASNTVVSNTTATGVSRTYKYVRDNPATFGSKLWNYPSYSPYYTYQSSSQWRQCWISDAFAYSKRLELVNQRGIAGIGIWALGYDDGYTDMWNTIKNNLSTCSIVPCQDTIYDMGGPDKNYYDKENYIYTIKPNGATGLNLNFLSFDVEANYDSLFLYNGTSVNSPLIGKYTGTNSPGNVSANSGAITLKFKSDNSTTRPGFKAVWSCTIDNTPPATAITSTGGNWKTTGFTANFTDTDNSGGTGVEKSYYQVLDNNGSDWRANSANGFFSDNFDIALNPEWQIYNGAWATGNGNLRQSDSTINNTNVFAQLNQNLSNRYLYHFTARVESAAYSTSQRRFGFHFHCDTGNVAQRGNSYFIFFRQETSKLEFYRVQNSNPVQTKVVDNIVTNIGQWYDIKIIHDRITGNISVYRDNALIGTWTDTNPLTTSGNYISFRTGNSKTSFGEIKVYRSRLASANISLGTQNSDIRFQNPSPSIFGAKIKSIVNDVAGNLSAINYHDLNVDWTNPANIASVSDGSASDIDTSYITTNIAANWTTSNDPNSGILSYWYAIGTTPGASDIKPWTNNGAITTVNAQGLNLSYNQNYFVSVKAENGAGLFSAITTSDGFIVKSPSAPPVAAYNISSTSVCTGTAIFFNNSSVNADSFSWSITGPQNFVSSEISPQFIILQSGVYTVQLTATGAGGSNVLSNSVNITIFNNPDANAGVDISACEGDAVTLNATGASQIIWNNAVINNQPFYPTFSSNYIVTVTNENNCSDADTVYVEVNNKPAAIVTGSATICSGDSVQLIAGGGTTYIWSNAISNGSYVSPQASSNYFVTVSNSFGCSDIDSVFIEVIQQPIANFSVNTQEGQPPLLVLFTNSSQNATSYRWYFGDGDVSLGSNPYHFYQDTGLYTVTLIAMNEYCSNDTIVIPDLIHVTDLTSVSNLQISDSYVEVFPNPLKNIVKIKYYVNDASEIKVALEDLIGRNAYTIHQGKSTQGINLVTVNIEKYKISNGYYFLKLYLDSKCTSVVKVVIEK